MNFLVDTITSWANTQLNKQVRRAWTKVRIFYAELRTFGINSLRYLARLLIEYAWNYVNDDKLKGEIEAEIVVNGYKFVYDCTDHLLTPIGARRPLAGQYDRVQGVGGVTLNSEWIMTSQALHKRAELAVARARALKVDRSSLQQQRLSFCVVNKIRNLIMTT